MQPELKEKYEGLLKYLSGLKNLAIAFSGGVDSAFLLHAAMEALGDKILALTINSTYIPDWEIDEAKKFAADKNIKHLVINSAVPEQIKHNPEDRCYLCKSFLFAMLGEVARQNGMENLADGSNADDTKDHRPGMKALKELNILSPLLETGFTKQEIRDCSKEMGLYTWEKPAYACLLTRIPYGTRIEEKVLKRIEKSETYLISLGIRAVRVRVHEELARIETEPHYIEMIFSKGLIKQITRQLKRYGFKYVTLDLEGYRTGGINHVLKKDE
jgi:pyridinium-3,5-biscarboxylic acid mononucleotide sulfurtransferase